MTNPFDVNPPLALEIGKSRMEGTKEKAGGKPRKKSKKKLGRKIKKKSRGKQKGLLELILAWISKLR